MLKLSEGVERADETLRTYVVTPQLVDRFDSPRNRSILRTFSGYPAIAGGRTRRPVGGVSGKTGRAQDLRKDAGISVRDVWA